MAVNKVDLATGETLIDLRNNTATEETILKGYKTLNKKGILVEGNIENKGSVKGTIDGFEETSYTIPKGYHDGTGSVSLTDDIKNALLDALENRGVEVPEEIHNGDLYDILGWVEVGNTDTVGYFHVAVINDGDEIPTTPNTIVFVKGG